VRFFIVFGSLLFFKLNAAALKTKNYSHKRAFLLMEAFNTKREPFESVNDKRR